MTRLSKTIQVLVHGEPSYWSHCLIKRNLFPGYSAILTNHMSVVLDKRSETFALAFRSHHIKYAHMDYEFVLNCRYKVYQIIYLKLH